MTYGHFVECTTQTKVLQFRALLAGWTEIANSIHRVGRSYDVVQSPQLLLIILTKLSSKSFPTSLVF